MYINPGHGAPGKTRRRQKDLFNEGSGVQKQVRDYPCTQCEKTYLSYPALYLHMKLKHVQQEGMPKDELKRGRGRGRPRKDGIYQSPYTGAMSNGGRLDPTNQMFLRTEDREGGPIDPTTSFNQNVQLLFGTRYQGDSTQHPMFKYLENFSYANTPGGSPDETEIKSERSGKPLYSELSQEIYSMIEPKKNMLNCEELFSIYMREVSEQVNSEYYSTVMQFLLMFRDCLNMYGWQKRAENECKEFYGQVDYEQKMRERLEHYKSWCNQAEYTEVNNAEFAPEICNEYVTVYMDSSGNNAGNIPISEIIDLTQHLCHWMFQNRLTCSKLSMVRN